MNITFYKFANILNENLEETDADLLNIIRSGNNLRKNECGDFWDDFINLCGDSKSMSKLFDVPKEKITALGSRINELRQMVKDKDSNKKNRVLKTGE
jgi:hypothetical protein